MDSVMASAPERTPDGIEPCTGPVVDERGDCHPNSRADERSSAERKDFDPYRYQKTTVPPGLRAELFAAKAPPVSSRRWEDTLPPRDGKSTVGTSADVQAGVASPPSSRVMDLSRGEEHAESAVGQPRRILAAGALVLGLAIGLAWVLATGQSHESPALGPALSVRSLPAPEATANPVVASPAIPTPAVRAAIAVPSGAAARGVARPSHAPSAERLRSGPPLASIRPAPLSSSPSPRSTARQPDIETPLLPE